MVISCALCFWTQWQVLETYGGSGPARALYYYRTGDILDDNTLTRLTNLARKAIVGDGTCDSPCDRMIRDLRSKCEAGELQFMIVTAPADTCEKRIGPYTVTTTLVTPDRKDFEDTVVVGKGLNITLLVSKIVTWVTCICRPRCRRRTRCPHWGETFCKRDSATPENAPRFVGSPCAVPHCVLYTSILWFYVRAMYTVYINVMFVFVYCIHSCYRLV